ncbi:hypothetical protein BDW60DRAFT_195533 [Aspergillus nidulans var. acristatus]
MTDKLESFIWDVGMCVPEELLGASGLLLQRQKKLKSISLRTELLGPICYSPQVSGIELLLAVGSSIKLRVDKGPLEARGQDLLHTASPFSLQRTTKGQLQRRAEFHNLVFYSMAPVLLPTGMCKTSFTISYSS